MALAARVKVTGVQDLSNARYCAGMGVEMLGFPVDNLSHEKYSEITGWLTGVHIVAETNASTLEQLQIIQEKFQPQYIQLLTPANQTLSQQIPNLLDSKQLISYTEYLQLPDNEKSKYIIELTAGDELRPGLASFDQLMDILEALETND
jgi:phosphoribosylanthranilate isomerase